MAKILQPVAWVVLVSRIPKIPVWKCPKCKSFNEDFMDECDCGYINKHQKKKVEEEKIEDFKFPNERFSDEIYR